MSAIKISIEIALKTQELQEKIKNVKDLLAKSKTQRGIQQARTMGNFQKSFGECDTIRKYIKILRDIQKIQSDMKNPDKKDEVATHIQPLKTQIMVQYVEQLKLLNKDIGNIVNMDATQDCGKIKCIEILKNIRDDIDLNAIESTIPEVKNVRDKIKAMNIA